MSEKKFPKVGIGVMIENDQDEVLLGLRKGSHGAGEWCFPGGHLDFGETIFETAIREVKEETGLDVQECELITVSDDFRYIESDGKHYVTIGVKAKYQGGQPEILEPEKCDDWRWFALDNLPENIFEGTDWVIKNYKNKTVYQPAR